MYEDSPTPKTYVHESFEVVLTGRVAHKKLRSRVDELVEIKPADNGNGSWTKWVRMSDLYEISVPQHS